MIIRFAVMGLLTAGPDHGYSLRQRFEERVGRVWDLNSGQVYQALRALERSGYVSAVGGGEARIGGPPTSRLYELTSEGREALDRWLSRGPALPSPTRDELLVRIALLESDRPKEAIERLEAQAAVHREHLADLLARKQRLLDATNTDGLVASFGVEAAIRQTMAYLGWLDHCRGRLEQANGLDRETKDAEVS